MNAHERDENLIVVYAVDEYAKRHSIPTADAYALFRRYDVITALRENYNTLHTQALDESADFAADVLRRRQGENIQ